jgi:hypothetical protein
MRYLANRLTSNSLFRETRKKIVVGVTNEDTIDMTEVMTEVMTSTRAGEVATMITMTTTAASVIIVGTVVGDVVGMIIATTTALETTTGVALDTMVTRAAIEAKIVMLTTAVQAHTALGEVAVTRVLALGRADTVVLVMQEQADTVQRVEVHTALQVDMEAKGQDMEPVHHLPLAVDMQTIRMQVQVIPVLILLRPLLLHHMGMHFLHNQRTITHPDTEKKTLLFANAIVRDQFPS